MVEIKKGVGDGAKNAADDAALVQVMLVLAKNPAGKGYLPTYDGVAGKHTKEAIVAFQLDQKLIAKAPAPAKAGHPAHPAGGGHKAVYVPAVAEAVPGVVNPNDPTLAKLLALIPPDFADMRVLPGGKTVYLPADEATMKANQDAIKSEKSGFTPDFRDKVSLLVETLWKETKIVVQIAGEDGKGRDFEAQYQLTFKKTKAGKAVTHAGPGESNHNFGRGVDLGFDSLQWVRPNGEVVSNEDAWMHKLDPHQSIAGEAGRFWALLRESATKPPVDLHRGPEWDHPHLQAWADAKIDMATRLASLCGFRRSRPGIPTGSRPLVPI